MTERRRPPRHATPALGTGQLPTVSGEYRSEERTRVTQMHAVRPEIRRATPLGTPAVSPASQGQPARYTTVQMRAVQPDPVEAPRSSGRMLDDALDFDIDLDADGALELDCLPSSQRMRVEQPRQSGHEAPSVPRPTPPRGRGSSPRAMLPPAPGWPVASAGPRRTTSSSTAVDTHAALMAFAGFGDPPDGMFGTPAYALRVIMRRRSLNKDLASARLRRSQDVTLYEASLRTADNGAVRMGLVILAMMLTLAVLFAGMVVHVLAGPFPLVG